MGYLLVLLYTLLSVLCLSQAASWSKQDRLVMREKVRGMVDHAFSSYMTYAFPHDELKPLSGTYTDSLGELGNAQMEEGHSYRGVAMTLIDALDTLAVVGNATEFSRSVRWISRHVSFDIDLRVNVFEINIRILGGLLSGHLLASDPELGLMVDTVSDADGSVESGYDGGLLRLAIDLGNRLMPAFENPVTDREGRGRGLPFAWVHLRKGLMPNEITETCTAVAGTLLLEFGLLSHLSGDHRYFRVADAALSAVWSLRSNKDLVGNTLDVAGRYWTNANAGIGSGIDSFYEYLFKAYVLFGRKSYLDMYQKASTAVRKYLKKGPWYVEADMFSGTATHLHFNSLQAFFPGLQVQTGHLEEAASTQSAFFAIWARYRGLPERYIIQSAEPHPTLAYYPLRPELAESAYFLYQATRNPKYLQMGHDIFTALENVTRVTKGYASVRDVQSGELEDHMSSFFLAETCKYLFLLFDEDNFVHHRNYVFSTEGHLFPISFGLHQEFAVNESTSATQSSESSSSASSSSTSSLHKKGWRSCPVPTPPTWADYAAAVSALKPSSSSSSSLLQSVSDEEPFVSIQANAEQAANAMGLGSVLANSQQCVLTQPNHNAAIEKDLEVQVLEGAFQLTRKSSREVIHIRNLGSEHVEIMNYKPKVGLHASLLTAQHVTEFWVESDCFGRVEASGSFFLSASYQQADARMVVSDPPTACSAPLNEDALRGQIVLVERGGCTFYQKISELSKAGAAAVIVGNVLEDNNVFMMGGDGSGNLKLIEIPALMVSRSSFQSLRKCALEHPDLLAHTMMDARATPSIHAHPNPSHLINQHLQAGSGTSSPPSSPVSMVIKGTPNHFQYTALGGWTLLVQERERVFHLHLLPTV